MDIKNHGEFICTRCWEIHTNLAICILGAKLVEKNLLEKKNPLSVNILYSNDLMLTNILSSEGC